MTDEAVYGTISADGQRWTIHYRAQGGITHSLSAAGPFPRKRFPAVPVLDYRTGDVVAALRLPTPAEVSVFDGITLRAWLVDVLARARDLGVTVYEPGEVVP
jgi:hypothetical protein